MEVSTFGCFSFSPSSSPISYRHQYRTPSQTDEIGDGAKAVTAESGVGANAVKKQKAKLSQYTENDGNVKYCVIRRVNSNVNWIIFLIPNHLKIK